jgi:hypothetical protein
LNNKEIETLYILSEQHKVQLAPINKIKLYFPMLRPEYKDKPFAKSIMLDFYVFYSIKDEPIINSNLELVYILRRFLLTEVQRNEQLKRLKLKLINNPAIAMIAAALTTNIYLDLIEQLSKNLTDLEQQLLENYLDTIKLLFKIQEQKYSAYPKQLVLAETSLLKEIRQYVGTHKDEMHSKFTEIVRFVDLYTLNEIELFDKGLYS